MEGTWTIPFPSFAIKATDLKQALSQNTQKGEMFSQNQGDLLGEKKKRKKKSADWQFSFSPGEAFSW